MLRSWFLFVLTLFAAGALSAAHPGQLVRLGFLKGEVILAPEISDFIDAAVVDYGYQYGAGLRADGTVAAWGSSYYQDIRPPAGLRDVVKIDGGNPIVIALKADGTVATWPDMRVNDYSFQPPLGLDDVVDVGAGYSRCYALKRDGSLVGWGEYGTVPSGLAGVQAISIGKGGYNLALKRDGSVIGWFAGNWGQTVTVPANLGDVVAVSAGYAHGLALRRDGTVAAWGNSADVQPPAGLREVVQVLAVQDFSYALRTDGSVVAWGRGYFGTAPLVPEGLVAASRLAGGRNDVVAIVGGRALDAAQAITLPAGYDLSLDATSSPPVGAVYQWWHDGMPLAGATARTLTIDAAQPDASGRYEATITDATTTRTSAPATVEITTGPGDASYLANLSTRGRISPERPLIVGLVLAPGATARELYLRGVGPSLVDYGVAGVAADPLLQVFHGERMIGANDDWVARTPAGSTYPSEDYQAVGAFALPAGSKDAAMRASFLPDRYTAVVRPASGGGGVALAECYDYTFVQEYAGLAYGGTMTGRLVNLATRGEVGAGEHVLVAGFVVRGVGPQRVLLRGIGPTLSSFGVPDAVAGPRLQLFRGSQVLAENSGWDQPATRAEIVAVAAATGAFSLPDGSADAAMVYHLQPGSYTLQLSAAAPGTGLIEIYEADE